MPRLTIMTGDDAGKTVSVDRDRLTLGRSVNNDLQIFDRRLSRSHAVIIPGPAGYTLTDLESKNGTLLNGIPVVKPMPLRAGDIIQVGDTEVLYEEEGADLSRDPETDPDGPTLYGSTPRPRRERSQYRLVEEHQWGATQGEVRAGLEARLALEEGRTAKELGRRLEMIFKVTEAVRSVFSIDELLEQIMGIISDMIQPDRAYLLMVSPETHQLIPEVIKTRLIDDSHEVKISTSIVERCMSEGVSLLVSDAAVDDRFQASESIIANRIRTAMVAPLIYKGETMGVVYVDTNTRLIPFSREELELLTGISNQAAVAISNARMHSQLVEQHKLAREMEIARTIQMNLLPKVYPEIVGFELSALSLPAKQVGGDYYDFLRLPDGRHGIAIADVSGKGVPAAILTATTRSYLQSETQNAPTPVETVARINRLVHRDVTNDMYVTMALVYLEEATGRLEFINAGHTHPILLHADGRIEYLERGGLFLGILEDSQYESGEAMMEPGAILIMTTDGVTDLLNANGEEFGSERLLQLVVDCQHLTAEKIRNRIYHECQAHRGEAEQFDDFTLIILKRNDLDISGFEDADFD